MPEQQGVIRGDWKTRKVTINGKYLSPAYSLTVVDHSPDGFAWGYGGSAPAQLALGILLEYATPETAEAVYQDFKWGVIARLPQADFEMPIADVAQWLDNLTAEQRSRVEAIKRHKESERHLRELMPKRHGDEPY